MIQQSWGVAGNKILVCVDSYEQGVLKGRFYDERMEGTHFESLSQFMIQVEQYLALSESRDTKCAPRTFTHTPPESSGDAVTSVNKGKMATFELQVLFRQHTSWQGVVYWLENDVEQSFRSVLELVFLMDSALRSE